MGRKDAMDFEREIFNRSGPTYLTSVDWNNFDHRRTVAASLVQGVYKLELGRQQNPQGPQDYPLPWWDFFHFQLASPLNDDGDGSIFGAIYKFKSYTVNHNCSAKHAPKYVIAFRGTIIKEGSYLQDFKLCLSWICNRFHNKSRFHLAKQAVKNMAGKVKDTDMWLVGHSLGSAIALLVGKYMNKGGCPIETHLFNPPFFGPKKIITDEKWILFVSVVKAGLAFATEAQHQRPQQEDEFVKLSTWLPFLFVNPADFICSGYIGYFENRRKMDENGAGKFERCAAQYSIRARISGDGRKDLEPLHLIASAHLTINRSESPGFRRAHEIRQQWKEFRVAHGIQQWWNPEFKFEYVKHQFE